MTSIGLLLTSILVHAQSTNADYDIVADNLDNCVEVYNLNQADQNDNGIGDVCDPKLRITSDCSFIRDELKL